MFRFKEANISIIIICTLVSWRYDTFVILLGQPNKTLQYLQVVTLKNSKVEVSLATLQRVSTSYKKPAPIFFAVNNIEAAYHIT